MKLHEIYDVLQSGYNSISVEKMQPYLKSLYTIYREQFCSEPILVVTDVFNSASYAFISSESNIIEDIAFYLNDSDLNDEDMEAAEETILANSRMLKNLIS